MTFAAAQKFWRCMFISAMCTVCTLTGDVQVTFAQNSQSSPSIITDESRALIEEGRAQLQAGNIPAAITSLTRVIRNEKIPPEWLAIAFFYRGIANRLTNESETAVADFVNALWLQTLPAQIVAQAHFHRAHSYVSLGKYDEAMSDFNEAQRLSPNEPRIAQARDTLKAHMNGETTGSINGAPISRDDAIRNALGNGAVLAPAPFMERPRAVFPANPENQTTSANAPVTQNSARQTRTVNGFRIQLGALASRTIAESTWTRVHEQYRDLLGGMQPTYEAVTRDGRTVTRLRAGYLPDIGKARELCASLKRRGQECIVVTR